MAGKRKRPSNPAEAGSKPPKRQSLSTTAAVRPALETSFASVEAILRALATNETSSLGDGVRQLGRACAVQPTPGPVREYLQRTPLAHEVLRALQVAQDANSVHLLSACFGCLSSILTLVPTSSSAGSRLIKSIFTEHGGAVSRSFAPGRSEATAGALMLMTTCADWGEGRCAATVWQEGMRWVVGTVGRLLHSQGPSPKGGQKNQGKTRPPRQNMRFLAVRLLFKLLSSPSVSQDAKAAILLMKGFGNALFRELHNDDYDFLAFVLTGLWENVLRDENWASRRGGQKGSQDGRWSFWSEEALEAIVKLLDRADSPSLFAVVGDAEVENVATLAQRFLKGLITKLSITATGRRSSQLSPQYAVLSRLLKILPPTKSPVHQGLVLDLLRAQPSLCGPLWRRHSPSEAFAASVAWIASVGFATKVIMLPLPADLVSADANPEHVGVPTLLAQCLPAALGKERYTKILYSGNNLVCFCALAMLLAGLKKAAAIVHSLKDVALTKEELGPQGQWTSLLRSFRSELKAVLPEPQVIISVLQKAPGLALEHFTAISRAGGAAEVDDDDPSISVDLMAVNALAALSLYKTLLSSGTAHRFDFSKLGPIFLNPTNEAPSGLGQIHILNILRTCVATEPPPTSKFLVILITLAVSSPLHQVRTTAKFALQDLVAVVPVFQDRSGEILLWVEALEATWSRISPREAAACVKVLDESIRACMRSPLIYLESASTSTAETSLSSSPSPFAMAFVENLLLAGKPTLSEGAVDLFASAALINLACHAADLGACSALAERIEQRCRSSISATSVLTILERGRPPTPGTIPSSFAKTFPLAFAVCSVIQGASPVDDLGASMVVAAGRTEQERGLNLTLHALASSARRGDSALTILALSILETLAVDGELARRVFLSRKATEAFATLCDWKEGLARQMLHICIARINQRDVGTERQAMQYLSKGLAAPHLVTVVGMIRELWPLLAPDGRSEALATLCDRAGMATSAELSRTDVLAVLGLAQASAVELSVTSPSIVQGLVHMASNGDTSPAFRYLQKTADGLPEHGAEARPPEHWAACVNLCLRAQSNAAFSALAAVVRRWPKAAKALKQLRISADSPPSRGLFELLEAASSLPSEVTMGILPPSIILTDLTAQCLFGPGATRDVLVRVAAARTFAVLTAKNLLDVRVLQTHVSAKGLYAVYAQALDVLCLVNMPPKAALVGTLIGQTLKWLVRRYAEDDAIDADTEALTIALRRAIESCNNCVGSLATHLVDPVVAVALQRWLRLGSVVSLCSTLCVHSDFQPTDVLRHLRSCLANSGFQGVLGDTASDVSLRTALVSLASALAEKSPEAAQQTGLLNVLASVYRGSLDLADDKILAVCRFVEIAVGRSAQETLARWRPAGANGMDSSLEALQALDTEACHRTCLFVLGSAISSNEASTTYDPDFVIPFYATTLASGRLTTPGWMLVAKTGAIGIVICASVSRRKRWQLAADRLLSQTLALIKGCRTPEANQLALPLEHLQRCSLLSGSVSPTLGLFLSRGVEAMARPTSPHFETISTFLLQRPTLDLNDAPLFYASMYSERDRGRADRAWILNLYKDGLLTEKDFRLLTLRQVPELCLAMAAVTDDDVGVVLQILERATRHSKVARRAIAKSGLCVGFEQLSLGTRERQAAAVALLANLSTVSLSLDATSLRALRGCVSTFYDRVDILSQSKSPFSVFFSDLGALILQSGIAALARLGSS